MTRSLPSTLALALLLVGCAHHAGGEVPDGGGGHDDGGATADGGGGQDGATSDGATSDGATSDGATSDGGMTTSDGGMTAVATCDAHHWDPDLSVTGKAMMAFRGKAYLFASDGHVWTVIDHGVGSTGPIPLPSGVTAMQFVVVELAPSGYPLVSFTSNNQYYATFFDGAQFAAPVHVTSGATVHADAAGRIYEVGSMGLVEHAPGAPAIFRGTLPYTPVAWTVGADGAVHILRHTQRPSTIHPGSTADDLQMTTLPHGSLTWSSDVHVASNEGWGFSPVLLSAAADGSLHVAYEPIGIYLRSRDGATWEESLFLDYSSIATMIDPAPGNTHIDPPDEPAKVGGYLKRLAAQDYDHAVITMADYPGSLYTPSLYVLRRCAPFTGNNHTAWPAERFAFSGLAFDEAIVAQDERGMTSLLTPLGMRQEVAGP
jgi:hypothetical protein